MKRILLVAAGVAIGLAPGARGGLREDFASPQGAARENTGPLFWMHGDETEARLREYVGRTDESGQGILTIESRPHADWMRAGWWRDVGIVLDACRKRGMKMMVFDDYWWPSQGMGGKYPIPERYRNRDVMADVCARGAAPARVENEIARVTVRETAPGAYALDPDAGDKEIVYRWTVADPVRPQGLEGGHGFPMVNGLDEEAVDWFLENYYQPYFDRYADAFRDGTIPGFFFDEPETKGWWGPALAQELAARGEDAGELLTALRFRLADPEAQARARYRFLDARAEVWGRTMYGRQSDWCARRGVYSSGHFMEHEECYYSNTLCAGNVMQLMKHVSVPGVDLVCRQYYPEQRESAAHQIAYGQMPKYASSVAHVYNRHGGLNWCEIFGAYGQDLTYPQMKWMCAWHQYQGCSYLIPHSFNPRAPHDDDCPPYFYNGGFEPRYPLFRVWADFNNRCALLLSGGAHVCRIAQCVPGISYHVGRTIRPEMFAFAIQDAQLDSDYLGYDAVEGATIGTDPRTGRPALRTADGRETYDILTLPATEYVPFATLEKARDFAKAGGVVLGYGIRPCNTPTRGKTAADARRVADEIFAQPTALFLDGEPDGAALRAALARPYGGADGRPLAVRELDFENLSPADARMLALAHYAKDGREIFFVANQDAARGRELTLRAPRAPAPDARLELWDPMQGTIERPDAADGKTRLSLAPNDAVFLVWSRDSRPDRPPRVGVPAGEAVPATVTETAVPVAVPAGGEDAASKAFAGAQWIWHPEDPQAEGRVTFRARVDAAAPGAARLAFACDNAAEVRVNGARVAAQGSGDAPGYGGWRVPTQAEIALKAGANEIEVAAENAIPGPAGFLAAIEWEGGALRTGDAGWEAARPGGAFAAARAVAPYGAQPWGKFGERTPVTRSPYAESVTTTLAFKLPGRRARVYLACDAVEGEPAAAVTVNGAFAGGFIGEPLRLDVTRAVRAGANTLEIRPFRVANPRVILQED